MTRLLKRKSLWIPLLILVVVVCALIAQFYFHTHFKQVPVTYTSSTHGFTIDYPSNLELDDKESGKGDTLMVLQITHDFETLADSQTILKNEPYSNNFAAVEIFVTSVNKACPTSPKLGVVTFTDYSGTISLNIYDVGTRLINGVPFETYSSTKIHPPPPTGKKWSTLTYYRTVHNNKCYTIVENIQRIANRDNLRVISEPDYNILKAELDPIVFTFRFTK